MFFVNVLGIFACFATYIAYGSESTAVLPKGIFRAKVENTWAQSNRKYNSDGKIRALGDDFQNQINASSLGKTNAEKNALMGFMKANGIGNDLGSFYGRVDSEASVTQPSFNYGVTDKLSIGLGTSIWSVTTRTEVVFQQTSNAQALLDSQGALNQSQKDQLASQLNDGAAALNQNLTEAGYRPVGTWKGTALGDSKLGAKYLLINSNNLSLSGELGIMIPTGRRDDYNNIQDLSFSQGMVSLEPMIVFGQNISIFDIEQHLSLSAPFADSEQVRISNNGSIFDSEVRRVRRKVGDTLGAGASVGVNIGIFQIGVGGDQAWKKQDQYERPEGYDNLDLSRNTDSQSTDAEIFTSVSTISLYRNGQFPIPMDFDLSYQQTVAGRNVTRQSRMNAAAQFYF